MHRREAGGIALSAAICTYDRHVLTRRAIGSLAEQHDPAGLFEIIIIDNSPNQKAAAHFREHYRALSNLTYLVETKPGLSNARSFGAAAAERRIVAVTDDDARACLSRANELLHAYAAFVSRAEIVGGSIVLRWADAKPVWIDKPLLGCLSALDFGRERPELFAVEWLAGCNISFDRKSLLAAGGFSTRLGRIGSGSRPPSNKDIQGTERVKAMGKLKICLPKGAVEHVIRPERQTDTWVLPSRRAAGHLVLAERIGAFTRPLDDHGRIPIVKRRKKPAVWRDAAPAYRPVIDTLCGGVEAEYSGAGACFRRSRIGDKIGRMFGRRSNSRSGEKIATNSLRFR